MLSRRGLIAASAFAAAAWPLGARAQFNRQASNNIFVTVDTAAGKLRGIDVGGIKLFRGVPYGAPTSGQNRFMPPQMPTPWTGIRDTFDWGQIAPQVIQSPDIDYVRMIDWNLQSGGMGEDLLTLNIWTRGLNDDAKRPVLVSFHGGGFTTGSSSESGYDGDPLARFADVVVVTVNHRLGALGFLDLGDIGAPPEFAHAGNAGMLDLVASLEWVRDNIASFGGDPGNVMIFGQSGGGRKVSTLMAMPAAKGLFHRAAIQSGAQVISMSREQGAKMANAMLTELGLGKSRIADLQNLPFEQILTAQTAVLARGPAHEFWPIVDGHDLPQNPFDPAAPEVSAAVPLIVSNCLNDAALALTNFNLTDAGLLTIVQKLVGPQQAQRVVDLYLQAYPWMTPYQVQAAMFTDRDVHRRSVTLAERKARQTTTGGAPVWMYRFDWPSPGFGGKFGAVHGIDVGLVFHNPQTPIDGDRPVAQHLADRLAATWVAFARTGNPATHDGFPEWPAYTIERRDTLVINKRSRVVSDPGGQFRTLWDELGV